MARRKKLDDFTRAYLEAALWSSTGDDGEPLDRDYYIEDFAPEAIKEALKDVKAFQRENADDLDEASDFIPAGGEWSDDEQHGHDFWLTRNGHGVGFWDRGYGAVGDRLSKAAERYGEVWPYVGDDGLVYFS
jgi:hypothetical protein